MRGRILPRAELSARALDEMYLLLDRHFDGTTRAGFHRDLAEKNWVLLAEDDAGRIQGFSTLYVGQSEREGNPIGVLCSGDTIMDPSARTGSLLAITWLAAVTTVASRTLRGPLHWLLICSGYRTYRFLPLFWKEYCPRLQGSPCEMLGLMDYLARERWGSHYYPPEGIVRFPDPQVLREAASGGLSEPANDPHLAFFLEKNPGARFGDELVCLTALSPENLTAAGTRILRGVAKDYDIKNTRWASYLAERKAGGS